MKTKSVTLPLFLLLFIFPVASATQSMGISRIEPSIILDYPKTMQIARIYNEGTEALTVNLKWTGVDLPEKNITLNPSETQSVTIKTEKKGIYTGTLTVTQIANKTTNMNPVIPQSIINFYIMVLNDPIIANQGIGINLIYLIPAILILLAVWRLKQ